MRTLAKTYLTRRLNTFAVMLKLSWTIRAHEYYSTIHGAYARLETKSILFPLNHSLYITTYTIFPEIPDGNPVPTDSTG